MKRFKHILAPTDLSPESLSVVAYAGHLARSEGAKLAVLHVCHSTSLAFTEFSPPIDFVNIDAAVKQSAREHLEKWAKKGLHRGQKVELVVKGGVTHETICDLAEKIGADLIVMATHGRKGLGRAIIGSVTERVLRDAPCPVLALKPPKAAAGGKGTRQKKRSKKPR